MKAKSKNEEILRESVSQVLQVNPDGIPVLQFPEVYKVYTMVNTILLQYDDVCEGRISNSHCNSEYWMSWVRVILWVHMWLANYSVKRHGLNNHGNTGIIKSYVISTKFYFFLKFSKFSVQSWA